MPSSAKQNTRLTKISQVPLQYAKPLRKTGYLQPYPHVVNGGILYKNHEYPVLTIDDLPHPELMDLFRDNEVSFSADRVKDARSAPWKGGP